MEAYTGIESPLTPQETSLSNVEAMRYEWVGEVNDWIDNIG